MQINANSNTNTGVLYQYGLCVHGQAFTFPYFPIYVLELGTVVHMELQFFISL